MKIGTLAIITDKFHYSFWNCWQTKQKIFDGKHKPHPCMNVESHTNKEHVGQLCEVVWTNGDYDDHIFVYVHAFDAYTDMYKSMLSIVHTPT